MKVEVSRVEMNFKHSTLGYIRKINYKRILIYFNFSYFSSRDNITLKLEQ